MTTVLRSLDSTHSTGFGVDDVQEWPENALDLLVSSGILRKSGLGDTVTCWECEEACNVEVEVEADNGGSPVRAFFDCPFREDVGRIWVPTERLATWALSSGGLASALAKELGTQIEPEEVVPGRLWWLGSREIKQRRVDLFFARGALWEDAATIFGRRRHLSECSAPVVLVPIHTPEDFRFGPAAKVLSLRRLLRTDDGKLILDRKEVERCVGAARTTRVQPVTPFPTPPGTTWRQVSIRFITDELVEITAGGAIGQRTFIEMGFVDRREEPERPDTIWDVLVLLARLDGRIEWEDAPMVRDKPLSKKHISDLRGKLRSYFCIDDNPFKPYQSENAYETKFAIVYPKSRLV